MLPTFFILKNNVNLSTFILLKIICENLDLLVLCAICLYERKLQDWASRQKCQFELGHNMLSTVGILSLGTHKVSRSARGVMHGFNPWCLQIWHIIETSFAKFEWMMTDRQTNLQFLRSLKLCLDPSLVCVCGRSFQTTNERSNKINPCSI